MPSGTIRVLYQFAGKVVAQRTIVGGSATVVYLHGDALGSTSATTSGSGVTTATQWYTPWGTVRAGGGLPTAIGFTGQRQDGTGLLYYGARYYDPGIGRFASADVLIPGLDDPQVKNRYSYALNNPLKFIDPTGHCTRTLSGEDAPGQEDENIECEKYISWLSGWGVDVDRGSFNQWMSDQLDAVWKAVERLSNKLGWKPDGSDFRLQVLRGGRLTVTKSSGQGRCGVGDYACTYDAGQTINVTEKGLKGANIDQWAFNQRTIAHELGHVWDQRSKDSLSAGLEEAFRIRGNRDPNGVPDHDRVRSTAEDVAEAVGYFVMDGSRAGSVPTRDADGNITQQFQDSLRWKYVGCLAGGSNPTYCGQVAAR